MKQTITSFFNQVKQSAIDPEQYTQLQKKPFFSAVGYLYILLFVLSVFQVLFIVIQLLTYIPLLPVYTQNIRRAVQVAYPKDLVLTVKNGVLEANVEQPYVIDIPQLNDLKGPAHFITIDTQATVEDYPQANTAILLTQNSIVYPDRESSRKGNYQVYPLKSIEKDFTIDKQGYDSVVAKILPFVNNLSTIVITLTIILALVAPFILAFFIGIGKLLYLLVACIIVFVIARIMGKTIRYGTIFILSMYGLTSPILLSFVQSYLPEPAQGTGPLSVIYHNLYTILFFIFMILVLRSLQTKKNK